MNLRPLWPAALLAATLACAAEPTDAPPQPPAPAASPAAPAPPETAPTPEEMYDAGQVLFETFAPPDIRSQYEFPSREQWDSFAERLQLALASNDLTSLAEYEPQSRLSLQALRTLPGYEDYADWLAERLDYIEAAKETLQQPAPPPPPPTPDQPAPPPAAPVIPHLDLWLQRMAKRPVPANAAGLMPLLREVFAAEGLPGDLAWLAETESTFNPLARSPAGARGLFQLMPPTARELGLSTTLPDDRIDPEKSARAAAQLLRKLHAKFGDWPLALAAYNAGAGRVQRTLTKESAKTFGEISATLPAETRMYVPKVLATLQIRSGLTLAQLSQ